MTTDTNNYDIAIIGAGPGGCATALALQGSGLKVVMVDKDRFPRDKICGDAIPSPTFKAMDKIKPEWGQALRQFSNKADIRTAKAFAPNGKTVSLNWTLYAYNSKRLDFDNFLAELVRKETTTTLIENTRLQTISVIENGVKCLFQDGTSINAALAIGCDGANSVVTRQLGSFDLRDTQSCAAVRAYYKDVEGLKDGVNEFHFFKELLPGYFWIFPLENGWANVGFGILSTTNGKEKKPIKLRDTLDMITKNYPNIAPRFKNAALMDATKGFALPLGTKQLPISGNRFMLCGDAAALIDPLQGHGIDNAMWSGLFAARQAVDCFNKADFSADFMRQYDVSVYKKLGDDLAKSAFIMRFFSRFPSLINVLAWLGGNQKLNQWVARTFKI